MFDIHCTKSRTRASRAVVCVFALAGSVHSAAAQTVVTATYIGPSEGAWSVAANWSTGTVPANTPSTHYNVVIPAGTAVSFSSAANNVEINSLQMGTSSRLYAGSNLDVLGNSTISGYIDIYGPSSVRLIGTGTNYTLNGGVRTAGTGSNFTLGATTLDWSILPNPASSAPSGISASGTDSTINFPNLTFINAAFNDNNPTVNRLVGMSGGASSGDMTALNLPVLTHLRGPSQRGDAFRFTIGKNFNAPVLSLVEGNTQWRVTEDASLPALTSLSNAVVTIGGPTQFSLPIATSLTNVEIAITGGPSRFVAPLATSYSWAGPAIGSSDASATVFRTASDMGIIDLSNLRTMDFSQDVGGARFDVGRTSLLNLSGLETMIGPARSARATEITLGASNGGIIDFSSLNRVSGNVFFNVYSSPTAENFLPALEEFEGARIYVQAGASFNSASIARIDSSQIQAYGAGSIVSLPGVASYSAPAYLGKSFESAFTIISAHDGATVTLPNLRTLNGTFDDGSATRFSSHVVSATYDGTIRLPSLDTVTAPTNSADILVFKVADGGSIEMGGVSLPSQSTLSLGKGRISVAGALRLTGNANITGTTDQSPTQTFLAVSGSFSYQANDHQQFVMNLFTLRMIGADTSTLEVGGQDRGVHAAFFGFEYNFNIGRLQIGSADTFSRVILVDVFDNFAGSAPEALYLRYGESSTTLPTSLQILGGSELWIGNVPVYARINGVMVDLHTLIPHGADRVAFDGGWIVIPAPAAVSLLAPLGILVTRRRRTTP